MASKSTVQAGNQVIHTKSSAVSDIHSGEVRKIVQDLIDTMRDTDLVGMAAPQIGKNVRVFVTEIRETEVRKKGTDPLRVFINPEIIKSSVETEEGYEGCGSVAGSQFFGPVKRPKKVVVKASDEKGKSFELEAEGLLARIICHEVDHLEGVLFVEKISDMRKVMSRSEYIKMKEK